LLPSASTIRSASANLASSSTSVFELQGDAELCAHAFAGSEEASPGAAAKAVAADPMHRSLEVNGNVVPIGKLFGDAPIARRIVLFEIVQRRIGKNTPKPKVSSARLRSYTVDLRVRALLPQKDRRIQAGGSATMIAIFMKPPAGIDAGFYLSLKQFPRQALSCRPFGVSCLERPVSPCGQRLKGPGKIRRGHAERLGDRLGFDRLLNRHRHSIASIRLVMVLAKVGPSAISRARPSAWSSTSSGATMRLKKPHRSPSSADMKRPV